MARRGRFTCAVGTLPPWGAGLGPAPPSTALGKRRPQVRRR